jgi:molybdenum cofactor cytidylyltransferase
MKFGAVPVKEALGATAVHTIRQDGLVLKKGTPIGPAEVAALLAAGITEVVVAQLEPGDVSEDVAAAEIAKAVAGEGVHIDRAFTGRANLFAHAAGILVVDKDAIDRLNRVDEAITLATLPAYKPVVAGEMIATVKIIPFAVSGPAREAVAAGGSLPHPQNRCGVDAFAGAGRQSDRQDLKNYGRTAGAGRRRNHCRAARAA